MEQELKTYLAPWARKRQRVLLACGKCQRKLRQGEDAYGLGKLKKALKKKARKAGAPMALRVLSVPCLKVCPRDGVTVCTETMLSAGLVAVVRTGRDVAGLHAAYGG